VRTLNFDELFKNETIAEITEEGHSEKKVLEAGKVYEHLKFTGIALSTTKNNQGEFTQYVITLTDVAGFNYTIKLTAKFRGTEEYLGQAMIRFIGAVHADKAIWKDHHIQYGEDLIKVLKGFFGNEVIVAYRKNTYTTDEVTKSFDKDGKEIEQHLSVEYKDYRFLAQF
jgi:hypothetical protein